MSAHAESSSSPSLFEWRTGFRVLVVDDNMPAADSLTKLLNKVGMHAERAYSAREALERDLSHFDVLLLDIGMPEMDGYELAHALRARGISTPIVALTGYGLESDKRTARDAGFSAHLTKPAGLREIREVLSQLA
jgi:CheY-like chemotaxis protein